jgi:hypothetical protein
LSNLISDFAASEIGGLQPNFCISLKNSEQTKKLGDSIASKLENSDPNTIPKDTLIMEKSDSRKEVELKLQELESKIGHLKQQKNDQMKEINFLKSENLNLKDELNFVSRTAHEENHQDSPIKILNPNKKQAKELKIDINLTKFSSIDETSEHSYSQSQDEGISPQQHLSKIQFKTGQNMQESLTKYHEEEEAQLIKDGQLVDQQGVRISFSDPSQFQAMVEMSKQED